MAAYWWWREWQLVSGGESGSLLVMERVAACGGGESGNLVVVLE